MDEHLLNCLPAAAGSPALLQALLAEPDFQTGQALYWAANEGDVDLVRALIRTGADINWVNPNSTQWMNASHTTPLMVALYKGHSAIAEILIAMGANLDMQDSEGRTALMWASRMGNTPLAFSLVAYKANLNLQNKKGQTALMIAIENWHMGIVEALLQNDADLTLPDKNGLTAHDYAEACGRPELIALLGKYSPKA